ncbi:hypothetical protein XA68_11453 [Ophiocordyceps unilateralis]|uniref:Uncharacterized protein n=1 Tax=Ophiocordyceps unilateralis TaxID=268505 RepID=A0A2A9NX43_OPHUN|nr:hypothetical protein XA68_11453 [Ophiocordyceps unilateralis]
MCCWGWKRRGFHRLRRRGPVFSLSSPLTCTLSPIATYIPTYVDHFETWRRTRASCAPGSSSHAHVCNLPATVAAMHDEPRLASESRPNQASPASLI